MAEKNPFDMTEMFRAFEPERMMKMWDPTAMMRAFQTPQAGAFDMEQIIRANQRNFEAMSEANRAAAEAYKDLLDKQMEIFEKMTLAARQQYDWVDDTAGPETFKARTAAMADAVEEAMTLMRRMSENAREANQKAYEDMKGQVEDAVETVQKKSPGGAKSG